MFADSLLDSAWPSRSRLGWSTLASFAVQAAAVSGLLLLPLIYTSGLPQLSWSARLLIAPSPAPPSSFHSRATSSPGNRVHNSPGLVTPQSVPRTIEPGDPIAVFSAPDPNALGISRTGSGGESGNGVDGGTGTEFAVAAPPPPPPVTHPPRVSRMMEGNLIYRPQPEYPITARLARIQGAVILRAVISKRGTIEDLQLVSGNPLLVRAALDAVRQWRYRPYILNGDPVEVDTQITVNFVLGGA